MVRFKQSHVQYPVGERDVHGVGVEGRAVGPRSRPEARTADPRARFSLTQVVAKPLEPGGPVGQRKRGARSLPSVVRAVGQLNLPGDTPSPDRNLPFGGLTLR